MRKLTIGIIIAGITFIIGVTIASVWIIKQRKHQFPASSPIVSQPPQSSTFRDGDLIIKSDGWPIPDISKLRKSTYRAKWGFVKSPVTIYHTGYDAGEMRIPEIRADGIADPSRELFVLYVSQYDIGRRVFCYRLSVRLAPSRSGEPGGGVVYKLTYYDLDGDGTFEGWDIADNDSKPFKMPQWANK